MQKVFELVQKIVMFSGSQIIRTVAICPNLEEPVSWQHNVFTPIFLPKEPLLTLAKAPQCLRGATGRGV